MLTKRQIRKKVDQQRIKRLVSDYNELFNAGKIHHIQMADILKVNITTFLRWRKLESIPNRAKLDQFEETIERMKG